jgi:hypothetical protein
MQTERQRDRETERQRDRETERQRDRETERQRDRETETGLYLHTHTYSLSHTCMCVLPGAEVAPLQELRRQAFHWLTMKWEEELVFQRATYTPSHW